MNPIRLNAAATLLLAITASAASAAPVGSVVFPKSQPGHLKIDQRIVASVDAFQFLKVLDVRGDWLWVERHDLGEKDSPGPTGWIRAAETDSIEEHVAIFDSRLRENAPTDPSGYFVLGLICQLSEDPDYVKSAISYYSRAIQLAPAKDVYYHVRALSWMRLNRNDKALDDFREAMRLDPDYEPYQKGVAILEDEIRQEELARSAAPPAPTADSAAPTEGDDDKTVSGLLQQATDDHS